MRRAFDAALIALVALVAPALAARALLRPSESEGAVAVIYAPWTDEAAAMARATGAGALVMGRGALPFVVMVKPDRAGYVDRVLADGALLALDPGLISLCLPFLRNGDAS